MNCMEETQMKKVFKLNDLDCANCAAKMEAAIQKLDGVKSATISFMTQKLTLEADDADFDKVLKAAQKCSPVCASPFTSPVSFGSLEVPFVSFSFVPTSFVPCSATLFVWPNDIAIPPAVNPATKTTTITTGSHKRIIMILCFCFLILFLSSEFIQQSSLSLFLNSLLCCFYLTQSDTVTYNHSIA